MSTRADAVVLPYHRSSLSGPLHIAMSAGLPVVVTAVGGLVEVVQDYSGRAAGAAARPDRFAGRPAATARTPRPAVSRTRTPGSGPSTPIERCSTNFSELRRSATSTSVHPGFEWGR